MDYEYFTNTNPSNIYIDKRKGRIMAYAVYQNQCCQDELLNKRQALRLSNILYKEWKKDKQNKEV